MRNEKKNNSIFNDQDLPIKVLIFFSPFITAFILANFLGKSRQDSIKIISSKYPLLANDIQDWNSFESDFLITWAKTIQADQNKTFTYNGETYYVINGKTTLPTR